MGVLGIGADFAGVEGERRNGQNNVRRDRAWSIRRAVTSVAGLRLRCVRLVAPLILDLLGSMCTRYGIWYIVADREIQGSNTVR
jgi:hypothetical protein